MDYISSIRAKLGRQKIILNCAGAIIETDGKILFQRRSDNGKWGLIGGLLELDETYEEAAVREVREETGLEVRLDSFLGIYHNYNMIWSNGDAAHVIGAYFKASVIGGELRKDAESLELEYFSRDEMPELFAEDHRAVVNDYLEGRTLNAMLAENGRAR